MSIDRCGRAARRVVPLLLLLAGACVAPLPVERGPVRVLVYNIHAGKDAAGRDNLHRVATLVRQTGADLALLQEVDRNTERSGDVDQIDVLSDLTELEGAFGNTLDFQGGEYGIALLSRWEILRDTLIRLPVDPPQERSGGSYEPRGVLHAVVEAPDGEVHVLNTHFDPSGTNHYRLQEAATVIEVAETLGDSATPVLIGGDLNSEPDSEVIALFEEHGWRDAWTVCGEGEGYTYPAAEPVKRIDYLLIPPGMECELATVVDAAASDHRPVLILLDSPPPPEPET